MEKSVQKLLSKRIFRESARRFRLRPDKLKLISDVENFVYESSDMDSPCILRITHNSHRTFDAIMRELEWMEYLHANNVSVPQPIPSAHEALVEVVEADCSQFVVTAFQKIPGKTILDANECTPEIYQQWGRILGKMHTLAKQYQPNQPSYKRAEWFEDDLVCSVESYIPNQISVLEKYRELIGDLLRLQKDKNCYGLIHADFTDVNFFVHDHKVTVFDFDDCTYHWFLFDIAVILYDSLPWFPHGGMNKGDFAGYFWKHFIQGYKKENAVEIPGLNLLTKFLKLREMNLYVFCHKKWNFENLSEQRSNYLKELKQNIENEIPYLNIESFLGQPVANSKYRK